MNMTRKEINELRDLPLAELMGLALKTKLARRGDKFSLCSIINAKSGRCSEDCNFCAQSAHFKTDAPVYPLKDDAEIIAAAQEAKRIGAHRFSLVTSGRGLPAKEVGRLANTIDAIRRQVDIHVCASLGILDKTALRELRSAGMTRYHHNLETSQEFFPKVVTTHTFKERLDTIRAAQDEGLEVCAGGIIGMGESEEDRISMALTLQECQVNSVPLNILIPLPGTPLAHQTRISPPAILKTIALYRLIHQQIPIRLAAGRESALGELLSNAFMAGADGMMIGGYLTQRGRMPEDDIHFVRQMQMVWTG